MRRRVKTTSCQDGVVPRRHRAETSLSEDGAVPNTVSCQHCVVPILRHVKTMSYHKNEVVSTRHRLNTMLCQHDVVSQGSRVITTPHRGNIVSTRCGVKMMSCQ